MTTRVRVSLGHERADRPHGWRIAASAAVGLAGGLLLVLALGRSLAPGTAPKAVPPTPIATSPSRPPAEQANAIGTAGHAASAEAPIHEPARAGSAADANATDADPVATAEGLPSEAGATAPGSASPGSAPPGSAPPEPVAAVPAVAPPPRISASHELVRGQIAYLRCEGVPAQAGPFPCPRDRRFERLVWSAVERLQQCALPTPAAGDVELRVEFRTRGRQSFEVRRADDSEAFATAARACLAPELELARTRLRPLLMTVAFRFELR